MSGMGRGFGSRALASQVTWAYGKKEVKVPSEPIRTLEAVEDKIVQDARVLYSGDGSTDVHEGQADALMDDLDSVTALPAAAGTYEPLYGANQPAAAAPPQTAPPVPAKASSSATSGLQLGFVRTGPPPEVQVPQGQGQAEAQAKRVKPLAKLRAGKAPKARKNTQATPDPFTNPSPRPQFAPPATPAAGQLGFDSSINCALPNSRSWV